MVSGTFKVRNTQAVSPEIPIPRNQTKPFNIDELEKSKAALKKISDEYAQDELFCLLTGVYDDENCDPDNRTS